MCLRLICMGCLQSPIRIELLWKNGNKQKVNENEKINKWKQIKKKEQNYNNNNNSYILFL